MPPKQPLTFNIFARLDHPWWLRSLLVAVLLLGLWIGMDFRGNAPTAIAIGGRVMVAAETLSFSTKGPIMVDGRMVFKVGSIDGFSAEVRASNANRKIQQLLDRQSPTQPADVTIQQQGELTTIRLNGQHLLTVTGGDYMAGVSPQEHARDWQQQLQMALQQAKVERTPAYQRRIAVIFVAALGGAIGLNLTLRWLRSRLLQRMLSGNFAHETPQRKRSPYYFLKIGQWCLWAIAGFYLTGLLPQTRTWRYQITNFVQAVLQNPLFQLGNTVYSLFDILKLLGLAVGLWLMVRVLTALLKSRILNKIGVEKEVQDITLLSAQILITGIGCVIILQALGIDARSLAILLSVLGVGVGFGLQTIASNFISGIILLLERQIKAGDYIRLGELNGTIERITIRSTEIRNEDNVSILVPNSELVQSKVINWNHGNPVSRIHIEFDVAYGTQIENLRDCVMEAVSVHPQLLQYPKPQLVFQGFGDSALNFELLVWVREPRYYLQFRSDLYYLLEQNFRRYQIEIPFPQQEIQLKPRQKIMSERLTHPLHPEENLPDSLAIAPPDKTFNKSDMEALQEKLRQVSVLIQQPSSLSDKAIVQLIQQMQGEKGVVVKDRRYGLKTYTDCFIGSEALLWLMAYLKATREEALLCGQMLVEKNFIHHVTYEHTLEDDYLFYQFSQFQSI